MTFNALLLLMIFMLGYFLVWTSAYSSHSCFVFLLSLVFFLSCRSFIWCPVLMVERK